MQRYGKRPIAWLNEIGYLNERLLAVHLTDANDDEVRQMACSGASMIACPGSIGIIDGIVPPSVVFQDAGGIVALGSDQAPGNNCHNMFNEMKLVAHPVSVREALVWHSQRQYGYHRLAQAPALLRRQRRGSPR